MPFKENDKKEINDIYEDNKNHINNKKNLN